MDDEIEVLSRRMAEMQRLIVEQRGAMAKLRTSASDYRDPISRCVNTGHRLDSHADYQPAAPLPSGDWYLSNQACASTASSFREAARLQHIDAELRELEQTLLESGHSWRLQTQ